MASSYLSTSGLDTPVELKLKLIPMLQHMHHDASLASSSRELLQHLVNSYPSTPLVIVTLHTFTQLAASSLIDIPKQVKPRRRRTSLLKLCYRIDTVSPAVYYICSTQLSHMRESDRVYWSHYCSLTLHLM